MLYNSKGRVQMNKGFMALPFLILGALIMGGADMTGGPLSLKRIACVVSCLVAAAIVANLPKRRTTWHSDARKVRRQMREDRDIALKG